MSNQRHSDSLNLTVSRRSEGITASIPHNSIDGTVSTGSSRQQHDPPSRRPSAIVIGSGFAGLAAANALHHVSFEVVVLEARNRIGGRAFTDHSFGFPLDLGAAWLHGVSERNPLARLIADLQLPLYRTSGDDSVLYDHDLESYALFDADGQKIPQELVARVEGVFEEMLEETRQLCADTNEDMNMEHALTLVEQRRPDLRLQGVERRVLQWYLCRMEGWFATDLKNLSAKCWEEEDQVEGGHGLMVNGYLPVLETLAAGLDIRYNHRVASIDWSSAEGASQPAQCRANGIGEAEPPVAAGADAAAERQEDHHCRQGASLQDCERSASCMGGRCDMCHRSGRDSQHEERGTCSVCRPVRADVSGTAAADVSSTTSRPDRPRVHVTTANGATFSADVAVITLPAGVLKLSVGQASNNTACNSSRSSSSSISNCSHACMKPCASPNPTSSSPPPPLNRSPPPPFNPSAPPHPNTVRFYPPLPPAKSAALLSIGVGIENKIALLFAHCFWPPVEFLGVVADNPYACSYFLNLHRASRGQRAVLVFMPAGRLAEDMERMGEREAVGFTMLQLRKILPLAPEPIQARITTWGSDPFSLGAYSYDAVHSPPDVYDSLRAPLPPLFFAGEATSRPHPGTVHGAFSTGRQAAREAAEFVRLLEGRDREAMVGTGNGQDLLVQQLLGAGLRGECEGECVGGGLSWTKEKGEQKVCRVCSKPCGSANQQEEQEREQQQQQQQQQQQEQPVENISAVLEPAALMQHAVSGKVKEQQPWQDDSCDPKCEVSPTGESASGAVVSLPVRALSMGNQEACFHVGSVSQPGKGLPIRISRL